MTLITPRRIATSRMSSAVQASIWSSLCSASLARYSFLLVDSPVVSTGPSMPGSAFDLAGVRQGSHEDPSTGGGGERRRLREPSGHSLNSSVSQRPSVPGPGARGRRRLRPWSACGWPGWRLDGLAVRAAADWDRLPHLDPDPPAKREPARPADRDRHKRDSGPHGEECGSLVEWQSDSRA